MSSTNNTAKTTLSEYEAFTKYYDGISKNGCLDTFLEDVEKLYDYCDLFEDVKNTENNEDINLYCDPIPRKKRSKDILYSSNLLKMKNSTELGRHLVAKEDIQRSTVVINECPTVLQVRPSCGCFGDSDSSLYRCHNCGVACRQFYTCDGCNVCVFCSRTCLDVAYKDYHRYECYGFQRHFWSMEESDYSYLSFRMMLYGASRNFVTDIKGEKYGDADNNYPFINSLETNLHKISSYNLRKALNSAIRNLLYLILRTNFFDKFKSKGDTDNMHNYIGGLMVKHYCQAQMNNVILKYTNYAAGWGIDVMSGSGKAICPTIALITHSCTPNCVIIIRSNYLQVKTVKPIEMGDVITVCYAEVDALFLETERQLILEEILCFSCKCYTCSYESNMKIAPYRCLFCFGGLAKKTEDGQGNIIGQCVYCKKSFSMESMMKDLKTATVCRDVYKKTKSTEHLKRLADCYKVVFPLKSYCLMEVYKLLLERHAASGEKPLEIMKYGLLLTSIVENSIARLYIPLIVSKLKLIYFLTGLKSFIEMKDLTTEEVGVLKLFVNEVMSVKSDLLFYLPVHKAAYFDQILDEVHDVYLKSVFEGDDEDTEEASSCTD